MTSIIYHDPVSQRCPNYYDIPTTIETTMATAQILLPNRMLSWVQLFYRDAATTKMLAHSFKHGPNMPIRC